MQRLWEPSRFTYGVQNALPDTQQGQGGHPVGQRCEPAPTSRPAPFSQFTAPGAQVELTPLAAAAGAGGSGSEVPEPSDRENAGDSASGKAESGAAAAVAGGFDSQLSADPVPPAPKPESPGQKRRRAAPLASFAMAGSQAAQTGGDADGRQQPAKQVSLLDFGFRREAEPACTADPSEQGGEPASPPCAEGEEGYRGMAPGTSEVQGVAHEPMEVEGGPSSEAEAAPSLQVASASDAEPTDSEETAVCDAGMPGLGGEGLCSKRQLAQEQPFAPASCGEVDQPGAEEAEGCRAAGRGEDAVLPVYLPTIRQQLLAAATAAAVGEAEAANRRRGRAFGAASLQCNAGSLTREQSEQAAGALFAWPRLQGASGEQHRGGAPQLPRQAAAAACLSTARQLPAITAHRARAGARLPEGRLWVDAGAGPVQPWFHHCPPGPGPIHRRPARLGCAALGLSGVPRHAHGVLSGRGAFTDEPCPSWRAANSGRSAREDSCCADEKYNFERLQRTTTLNKQPLLQPQPLELSPTEELAIRCTLPDLGTAHPVEGPKDPTAAGVLRARRAAQDLMFSLACLQG